MGSHSSMEALVQAFRESNKGRAHVVKRSIQIAAVT